MDREHHRERRRSHGGRNPDALQGCGLGHSYHDDHRRPHLYRGRPHGQARFRKIRSMQPPRVPQTREEVKWLEEGKAFPSLQPRPRPKCQARLQAGFSFFTPSPAGSSATLSSGLQTPARNAWLISKMSSIDIYMNIYLRSSKGKSYVNIY